MGVYDPMSGVNHGMSELVSEVKAISRKLDRLVDDGGDIQQANNGDFYVFTKSKMVWWTKVETAARYRLKLLVSKDGADWSEIDVLEIERECAYHVFNNLPKGIKFRVLVEAEDRNGECIKFASIYM